MPQVREKKNKIGKLEKIDEEDDQEKGTKEKETGGKQKDGEGQGDKSREEEKETSDTEEEQKMVNSTVVTPTNTYGKNSTERADSAPPPSSRGVHRTSECSVGPHPTQPSPSPPPAPLSNPLSTSTGQSSAMNTSTSSHLSNMEALPKGLCEDGGEEDMEIRDFIEEIDSLAWLENDENNM